MILSRERLLDEALMYAADKCPKSIINPEQREAVRDKIAAAFFEGATDAVEAEFQKRNIQNLYNSVTERNRELKTENETLRRQLEDARGALEFYALWPRGGRAGGNMVHPGITPTIFEDRGRKAREALARIKESGGC